MNYHSTYVTILKMIIHYLFVRFHRFFRETDLSFPVFYQKTANVTKLLHLPPYDYKLYLFDMGVYANIIFSYAANSPI